MDLAKAAMPMSNTGKFESAKIAEKSKKPTIRSDPNHRC